MTPLSWLWLLLGFIVPLCVFLILSLLIKFRPARLWMLACGAALLPAVTLWLVIFSSPYWREGTQIAWTGLKATGVPLSIGGTPEESIVGWPTNAEEPQLVFSSAGGSATQTVLEIKGGGAFVFDEGHQQLLNGEPLPVGVTRRMDDYQIRVNRLGFSLRSFFRPEIEVLDANGRSLAGFALRENRTRSLRLLIAGTPMEDLSELKDETAREHAVAARQKLEEWAADIWLFRQDSGKVQILSRNASHTHNLQGPTKLSVKWPTMTLTFNVGASRLPDGVVQEQLSFQSPWRLASPLPPSELAGCQSPAGSEPGELRLMLVGSARPCDIAFVLPLGRDASELRQEITISSGSAKFTTPDAIDNDNLPSHPPNVIVKRNDIGTSQLSRAQGPYSFDLATVKNLPNRTWMLVLILMAWGIFCVGMALALPRMVHTNRLIVYGVSLVAWSFLCFRLLLSFRYALDPAALDAHAVEGVTLAFIGLTVTPGLMLLLARLRSDRFDGPANESDKTRAIVLAVGYVVALCAGALVALYSPARLLWTELPDTYYASLFSRGGSTFLLIMLVIFFILVHIRFLYLPDDSKSETKGKLTSIFVSSWYAIESYFADKSAAFWEERLTGRVKPQILYFLGGVIVFVLLLAVFFLVRIVLPGDKTAQEMSVPTIFIGLTLLWLGLRGFFKSSAAAKSIKWTGYVVLVLAGLVMITGPSILLPLFIGDFGSIVPILAIIFPLTWLLIIVLPAKARLCVMFSVLLIFASGLFLYKNIEGLIPFHKQFVSILPARVAPYVPGATGGGRLFARLLNYKEGFGAQRFAITANSIVGGEGLPYQELLNGNQHTWENRAIAHQGGWFGMGFGKAPTRMSHVRQDTLQYDSVFSFFIVSEYGLVGGMLLLLLYVAPLVLVFLGGKLRFDGGYGIAYIIASMFLLEALYHMGMNLGSFPMTGRNLPVLSVNSPTDLIRWTIMFCLIVTVIFWRYRGEGALATKSPSMISDSANDSPNVASDGLSFSGGEPVVKYALVFFVVPFLFASAVLYGGWGVMDDEENELKTYNYKAMMEDVGYYLQNGIIDYVDGRLKLNRDRLKDPDEKSFLEREIVRFNVEDQIEKEERFRKEYIRELNQRLRTVRSLAEYNNALLELSNARPPEVRRNIFRLRVKTDEDGNVVETVVEPNSDFNISFSFQEDTVSKGLARVTYGDQAIIGPAWIRGRVRAVTNPDATLPWVAQLRDAVLSDEGRAMTNSAASGLTLTLDPALHEAASDFVTAKGLQLHEGSLASQHPLDPNEPLAYVKSLPQRVALSVLDLMDGKTLALGGWPRMTSTSRQWVLSSVNVDGVTKTFWIPTNQWLEREAPRGFRTRYGGERNFERVLVMGSSTKPIWAAAVLRTHPRLGALLHVRGAAGTEASAFGVTLPGKGWQLNSRTGDWVGLNDYLQTSDNRYHVRLGLLGLSSGNDGIVNSGGTSGSVDESLSPSNEPWGMYPAFITPIQVARRSGNLEMGALGESPNRALANSELANNLRDMFSIGINRVQRGPRQVSEFGPRRSFWTKNESNDLMTNTSLDVSAFDSISPQAPDFAFYSLTRPRDYITMLLGGGNNSWSNVDLAAAFGSCVLGRPVIGHIVADARPITPLPGRQRLDQTVAAMLRPGLNAVVESEGGTAYRAFHSSNALSSLRNAGVRIYAKTGTLKANEDEIATSRIVLALVRWRNEAAGEIESGLVFALVAEEARSGTATNWLRDFMIANESEILRLLHIGTSQVSPRVQEQAITLSRGNRGN